LVIGNEVDGLMAPYDESKDVRAYRVYMTKEKIKSMRGHYEKEGHKIKGNKGLLPFMKSWNGHEGKIDRKGIYYMSTHNKGSKWDWYEVGGRWRGKIEVKAGAKSGKRACRDPYEFMNLLHWVMI
jgi:hypothetical protein